MHLIISFYKLQYEFFKILSIQYRKYSFRFSFRNIFPKNKLIEFKQLQKKREKEKLTIFFLFMRLKKLPPLKFY